MDQLLEAMETNSNRLETKIDSVAVELGLLRDDSRKMAAWVTDLESTVQILVPETKAIETGLAEVEA